MGKRPEKPSRRGGGGGLCPPPPPPPLHVFEEAPLQLSTDGRSESIRMDWVHQKFPRIFREEQRRLIRIDPNRFTSRCETPPPPPLPTTTQTLVPPPPPRLPTQAPHFALFYPLPSLIGRKSQKLTSIGSGDAVLDPLNEMGRATRLIQAAVHRSSFRLSVQWLSLGSTCHSILNPAASSRLYPRRWSLGA